MPGKCGHITEEKCEAIILQFREFVRSEPQLSEFDVQKSRPDVFLHMHMSKKQYCEIWDVVKILLTLSHGEASVERGFSINTKVEIENLAGDSYISLRTIIDHVNYCGGIENVEIGSELKAYVSVVRQKYMEHLEKQRLVKCHEITKRDNSEEFDDLQVKRRKLQSEMSKLTDRDEKCSATAKALRDLDIFIKCDDMRDSVKYVKEEIDKLDLEISKKKCILKITLLENTIAH